MASIRTPRFLSLYSPHRVSSNAVKFKSEFALCHGGLSLNRLSTNQNFQLRPVRVSVSSNDDQTERDFVAVNSKYSGSKFQETISSLPTLAFVMKKHDGNSLVIGLCLATAILFVAVRIYVVRKSKHSQPGSVADLVRRGQLRSDRRGILRPLKYDDPFSNPLVKVHKSNSTVEMCGKVYRLAPVTLTEEERVIHQKRRSRAYQWKRPTMFLKEGDSIPPDVDPDAIRWIPANHPFATTASDIDENLAQNNVYQKHGVPFRIQIEHEALQRKLESLQSDQRLNKLVIDSSNVKDFERVFKVNQKSEEPEEQNPFKNQSGTWRPPKSDSSPNGFGSNSSLEEMPEP